MGKVTRLSHRLLKMVPSSSSILLVRTKSNVQKILSNIYIYSCQLCNHINYLKYYRNKSLFHNLHNFTVDLEVIFVSFLLSNQLGRLSNQLGRQTMARSTRDLYVCQKVIRRYCSSLVMTFIYKYGKRQLCHLYLICHHLCRNQIDPIRKIQNLLTNHSL